MDDFKWGEAARRPTECCRPEQGVILLVTDLISLYAWGVLDLQRGVAIARGTAGTAVDAKFEAEESYRAYRNSPVRRMI